MSSYDSNLRQVNSVGDSELSEHILHPIHDRDEGLHPRVSTHLGGLLWQPGQRKQLAVHVTAANMRLWRPGLVRINTGSAESRSQEAGLRPGDRGWWMVPDGGRTLLARSVLTSLAHSLGL